jgi:hypothetical protein
MPAPAVLQVGDLSFTSEQVVPLITKYRLLPQLVREIIIEEAVQHHYISEAEHLEAYKQFYQQQQLQTEQDLERWLEQQHLQRTELGSLIDRELRLEKFKTAKWGYQLEAYFCQRKAQIDQVIFSIIRVKDLDIAEEIFFRLFTKESSFVELAPLYSEGAEARTKGISGPVELGRIDPVLANALLTSPHHEVLPPTKIGDWWVVCQREAIVAAQLDATTRQRLTEELFTTWLNEEVQKLLNKTSLPVAPLYAVVSTAA